MNVLKNLAISLLIFLLFLSLAIFGIAFTVNSTALNPDFVTAELNRLDIAVLVDEFLDIEAPPETPELEETIIETVSSIEPLVKEQASSAIHSVYDYLLGEKEEPELEATLGDTFLNSDFVSSVLDELDLASLTEVILNKQTPGEEFPEEFRIALVNTIAELEPMIKERVGDIAEPIFDYLLGKTQSIDLTLILRNYILNSDFVVSLIDELDLSSLAGEFLSRQLIGEIPEEMEFLSEHLYDAIAELEPTIKEELIAAADPMLDYLLGESHSLSVIISLEPAMESLEDTLRETLLELLPPEYFDLSQSEINRLFDEYFSEGLAELIPSTFELDESLLGTEVPANIANALAEAEGQLADVRQEISEALLEAEEPLEEARRYISYFQLGYTLLIVFMALIVLGIILIIRQVKPVALRLGIPLLTYGAIEYAGIFVARYFIRGNVPLPDIPSHLETWLFQFMDNLLHPLVIFSLGLLICGAVLIVVSFVYKRGQSAA